MEKSHFAESIPATIRHKIKAVADLVKSDLISDLNREAYGAADISPIYGYHVPGFIPFQKGGYEITELYRNDTDMSYPFSEEQTDYNNQSQADMYKAFAHDHKDELQKSGLTEDQLNDLHYDAIPESLQNTFSDYESDWFDPALARFEIWINDDGENNALQIHTRLSINFKDGSYYHSKYDTTLAERIFSLDEFLAIEPEELIKHYQDAI